MTRGLWDEPEAVRPCGEIPQEVPDEVWDAQQRFVALGFTDDGIRETGSSSPVG